MENFYIKCREANKCHLIEFFDSFSFEYGFIKGTRGEDGDPLDCILLSTNSTFPGCLVKARVISVLEMEDEGGIDTKVVTVPNEKIDPRFEEIQDVSDLGEHTKKEITEFFEVYKRLETGKLVVKWV